MLLVTLPAGDLLDHLGLLGLEDGHGLRARRARAIFRKVSSFSQTEMNHFGTPSLITRNTNDVQQVQMLVRHGLNLMIMAPIMCIGGIIMAMREDVPLSALLARHPAAHGRGDRPPDRPGGAALPVDAGQDRPHQPGHARDASAASGSSGPSCGRRTRRSASTTANLDLTDTSLRVNRLFALMIPSLFVILNLSTVAIMWFGGMRVASGAMPIGNLTAFLQYVMQILFSVMMAIVMFVMVPRAAASADRIQEVLDTEPTSA